jgi:hypothetical protein
MQLADMIAVIEGFIILQRNRPPKQKEEHSQHQRNLRYSLYMGMPVFR